MEREDKGIKVADVLFIVFVLLMCVLVLLAAKGKMPAIFGYRILHVISGSMEPEIETGSYILIKETDPDKLKEGDVITFISSHPAISGQYNTHRIFDICKDTYTGETLFITKGDAFESVDEYPVYEDKVVGKLVTVIPIGEKISSFISKGIGKYGLFAMVVTILGICGVSYVVQALSDSRKKTDAEE